VVIEKTIVYSKQKNDTINYYLCVGIWIFH